MRVRTATIHKLIRAWLVLFASGTSVLAAMAGHAAWAGGAAPHPDGARAVTPIPAAVPVAPVGAPAIGATGTIALPALPPQTLGLTSDASVVAARPFRFGSASTIDRGRALECLTAAIYFEAGAESDAGQQAVAQVVLNRVRHPAFPASVCGVVYQGSERTACQFSFACDGALTRIPSAAGWARAARVAALALAGRVFAPVGLATHYHTYAVNPPWNRTLVMTDMVGAHLFHRWKGWWGTAAAFGQIYAGGEPMPGPHLPPAVSEPATVVLAAAMPVPPRPVADTMARPQAVMPAETPAAPADHLPPAPMVLERWKDSGKPL